MFEKLLRVIRIALPKIIRKTLVIYVLNIIGMLLGKIIRKALVKRWVEKISQIYEMDQFKKERDIFNREQVCLNFTHYLPDTEERIERLRRVINKRPVAIILQGPSATELEERITELEDCDICYATLNDFQISEKHVLQKINRNFSIFMCSSPNDLYKQIDNRSLFDYVERQEENLFISERDSFHLQKMPQKGDLDKFVKKYDKKLLFFVSTSTSIMIKRGLFLPLPSIEYPLHFPNQGSFSILLSLVLIGQAPMVVIFGGDGGTIKGRELYFREYGQGRQDSVGEPNLMTDPRIFEGTIMFNATMPLILEKIYKIYNLRPVDIVNCSVQSYYTPMRKLSYDETFALLKSFKMETG